MYFAYEKGVLSALGGSSKLGGGGGGGGSQSAILRSLAIEHMRLAYTVLKSAVAKPQAIESPHEAIGYGP